MRGLTPSLCLPLALLSHLSAPRCLHLTYRSNLLTGLPSLRRRPSPPMLPSPSQPSRKHHSGQATGTQLASSLSPATTEGRPLLRTPPIHRGALRGMPGESGGTAGCGNLLCGSGPVLRVSEFPDSISARIFPTSQITVS